MQLLCLLTGAQSWHVGVTAATVTNDIICLALSLAQRVGVTTEVAQVT